VHCSRVFRSSAPSDLLPSRRAGARQVPPKVNAAALDQWNGGSAPVAECRTEDAAQAGKSPARHIPEGTLPGPVRSQGRVARCDPELVARAQRAATRLESAWEQWRALHGLAVAPGQLSCRRSAPAGPAAAETAAVRSLHQVRLTESLPEGTGEYPSSALLGAPVSLGRGRQSADQAGDMAGWTSGELPGQVSEQLASWRPGADQPTASA
jgi:hypothetical protein